MHSLVLLATLLACGQTQTPPPGTLLMVQGKEGDLKTLVQATAGIQGNSRTLEVGSFPTAPDPRGTHSAQIRTSEAGEHQESLWLVSLKDDAPVALSTAATKVRNPAWSHDGSWIVYESDANSFRDLYRVNRDGTGKRRLTDQQHGSFEPHVSPEGKVVFGTSRDRNAEIYVMDADGANPKRMTQHPADDVHPRWSPDGKQIAWISSRQGGPAVWRMNANGTGSRRIKAISPGSADLDFAWSPDGKTLAVVTRRSGHDLDIQLVNLETHEATVIGDEGICEHPAWSPDGQWLAYTRYGSQGGDAKVVVYKVDGTYETEACVADCWLPRWLPDHD